jgi:hypothetical protein
MAVNLGLRRVIWGAVADTWSGCMFAHGRARRGRLAPPAQLTRSGSAARLLHAASVLGKSKLLLLLLQMRLA